MSLSNMELFRIYKNLSESISVISGEIQRRNIPWQTLADYDLLALAVMKYSRDNKVSLSEATKIVDAYRGTL